jgi:hypothetical protein
MVEWFEPSLQKEPSCGSSTFWFIHENSIPFMNRDGSRHFWDKCINKFGGLSLLSLEFTRQITHKMHMKIMQIWNTTSLFAPAAKWFAITLYWLHHCGCVTNFVVCNIPNCPTLTFFLCSDVFMSTLFLYTCLTFLTKRVVHISTEQMVSWISLTFQKPGGIITFAIGTQARYHYIDFCRLLHSQIANKSQNKVHWCVHFISTECGWKNELEKNPLELTAEHLNCWMHTSMLQ